MRVATTSVALAVLFACGCAGLTHPIERPTAELKRLGIVSMSLTGATLRAEFDVTNPNSVSIPIKAIDWELSIGGGDPFRGRAEVDTTIPAMGSAPLYADVELSAVAAASTLSGLASGSRDYRIGGVVHFATMVGQISVSFSDEGTIDEQALGVLR